MDNATWKEEIPHEYEGIEGKPAYDDYLPGFAQVLIEWIILIVSTLVDFFKGKE